MIEKILQQRLEEREEQRLRVLALLESTNTDNTTRAAASDWLNTYTRFKSCINHFLQDYQMCKRWFKMTEKIIYKEVKE